MADNVPITAGSGTTIGADEIDSVKYQRVKLIHGADGTNAGDVAAGNPLPVTDSALAALLADSASETTLAAVQAAVEALRSSATLDDIVTALTALNGYVDGLETLLGGLAAINATLGSPAQAGAAIPAGEAHIGATGFDAFDVTDAPATTNGAYSAGDVQGGYRTVTLARDNDKPILIAGVSVIFKSAVQPNVRVAILGGTPDVTIADNAAYTLSAANALLVRRTLSSVALGATYISHGTPKEIALVPPLPIVMKPITGGKTIGYYLVDDSGVTLTSTADVQVRFTGLQG